MEDNQSQSYDEAKLQQLRRSVQVDKPELLQLAYSEDLLASKIDQLNLAGCNCTAQQLFYEALVYLSEAERVLEYAASCGRTIDRALIVTTLHNQAAVYQRIWQLTRSADYIEAIIYNVSALLSAEAAFPLPPEITDPRAPQHLRFASYLTSKLALIAYHLQYCAVSSQIKNHTHALASAQKSLTLLKTYCEELHAYERMTKTNASNDFERTLLVELQSIRDFQNQGAVETERYIEKLMYKAKKSIVVFQKKVECGMEGLAKGELKQLESFSLGQLMQIGPIALQKVQQRLDIALELTLLNKVYKAIYISIAHFTMATELRLIASDRYGIDSAYRKQSKQFKQSQAHHLVAVITAALYVPCYTKYFEHILNSFRNHYQVDLSQLSELPDDPDNDDLVHLEIQSVSNKDSDLSQPHKTTDSKDLQSKIDCYSKAEFAKRNDRSTHDKPTNRTTQETNPFNSASSSENSKLRQMNKTGLSEGEKSARKTGRDKSKHQQQQQQTREKKIIIVEKVVSKSRSKGKGSVHKRSKSRKSVHEEEKIVNYFQYDNYSKKVVSKKVKSKGPSDLLAKGKPVRDKKSPQGMINAQLKKMNQLTQSSRDLINGETQARVFKKCKSPELNASRSPNVIPKKK